MLRAIVLSGVLSLSACNDPPNVVVPVQSAPKIDGSSEAAFESSHARLLESLAPEDRLKLSLAEILVLESRNCLTTKPVQDQSELGRLLGGRRANLSSCRKELHGMTFQSIMEQAYAEP